MDCVFVKARKISKSLKGNRGSVVNYAKYLDRTLDEELIAKAKTPQRVERLKSDFAKKGKLLAMGIDGTDETHLDFWKNAEERELQTKRKDAARFAKEYIVGLPHNLPIEEMVNISKTISTELSKNGRVVSWYLHEPDKDDESNGLNYHTHFLLSEREYDRKKKVFSEKKNRDWNTKATLQNHKKTIGGFINERLRELNLPEIKIELSEDEIIGINKTENQIKAEKGNRRNLKRAERKIKLAEVKLNGLRGTERQPANELSRNSESDNGLEKQFAEFEQLSEQFSDFQRTADSVERAERAGAEELERKRKDAERQRIADKQRAEREHEENERRASKSNNQDFGFSR